MGCNVNAVGIVGFVFAVVGAGALGTSMGTVYWQTVPGVPNAYVGLFETCTQAGCTRLEWSIEGSMNITLVVTRSILAAASLLLFLSILFTLTAFCDTTNIQASGVLAIVSGFLALIGCAVYTALLILYVDIGSTVTLSVDYFGVSYYICWGSGPVIILAGILLCCGRKSSSSSQIYPEAEENHEMAWSQQPPTNPYYRA